MYYNVCNGTEKPIPANLSCVEANISISYGIESEWPLERVVSMVVPVFFGIIGLCGLLGNALVIIGKSVTFIQLIYLFILLILVFMRKQLDSVLK